MKCRVEFVQQICTIKVRKIGQKTKWGNEKATRVCTSRF